MENSQLRIANRRRPVLTLYKDQMIELTEASNIAFIPESYVDLLRLERIHLITSNECDARHKTENIDDQVLKGTALGGVRVSVVTIIKQFHDVATIDLRHRYEIPWTLLFLRSLTTPAKLLLCIWRIRSTRLIARTGKFNPGIG